MHVDHNTDPTFAVLNEIIKSRPGFSSLVKTAQVGADVRESLPSTAFADPDNRLFPVHTPEDSLLSAAYAEKQAGVPGLVMSKISKALEAYEVSLPEEVVEKVAFDKVAYVLEDTRQLPIRGEEDIPKAEKALIKNAAKFRPQTLARAANVLIKEAAERGLNVSTETLSYAGLTRCDLDKAAESIEIRGEAAPAGREYFSKLASYTRNLSSDATRGDLVSIADAVGKLDENYGIQRHYGRSLPNPMQTVFNTKVAMGPSVDLAGKSVPMDKLMSVGAPAYADILGEDIVSEITDDSGQISPEEMAAIFETLPLDMKKLLVDKLGF